MSAATEAKTAKERARIAARWIRAGRRPSRAFDDCFEMGDGGAVVSHLRIMAQRSEKLRANWSDYLSTPVAP